jgi:hypothetical protein
LSVSTVDQEPAAAEADLIRDAFGDQSLVACTDPIERELTRGGAAIEG